VVVHAVDEGGRLQVLSESLTITRQLLVGAVVPSEIAAQLVYLQDGSELLIAVEVYFLYLAHHGCVFDLSFGDETLNGVEEDVPVGSAEETDVEF
jgi:hypothetical protein